MHEHNKRHLCEASPYFTNAVEARRWLREFPTPNCYYHNRALRRRSKCARTFPKVAFLRPGSGTHRVLVLLHPVFWRNHMLQFQARHVAHFVQRTLESAWNSKISARSAAFEVKQRPMLGVQWGLHQVRPSPPSMAGQIATRYLGLRGQVRCEGAARGARTSLQ